MLDKDLDKTLKRRVRSLSVIMIFSITLNIAFILTFIYLEVRGESKFEFSESGGVESQEEKPLNVTIKDVLLSFRGLTFQELVEKLNDEEIIEDGYRVRDVALSCLVVFHNFNINGAIGSVDLQFRKFCLDGEVNGENVDVYLFPSLNESHYSAIFQYLKVEKWPLTAKGIFHKVRELSSYDYDETLLEAFYHTNEFYRIRTLFFKSNINFEKKLLAEMLLSGTWSSFVYINDFLKKSLDFSNKVRKEVLFLYFEKEKSKIAARFLMELDYDFMLRKPNDDQIILLFMIMGKDIPKKFLEDIVLSPRGDDVLGVAKFFLLGMESIENKTDVVDDYENGSDELDNFYESYVVQAGDSLWKIAKKFNTSIASIVNDNHLKSDFIMPGDVLKISKKG